MISDSHACCWSTFLMIVSHYFLVYWWWFGVRKRSSVPVKMSRMKCTTGVGDDVCIAVYTGTALFLWRFAGALKEFPLSLRCWTNGQWSRGLLVVRVILNKFYFLKHVFFANALKQHCYYYSLWCQSLHMWLTYEMHIPSVLFKMNVRSSYSETSGGVCLLTLRVWFLN